MGKHRRPRRPLAGPRRPIALAVSTIGLSVALTTAGVGVGPQLALADNSPSGQGPPSSGDANWHLLSVDDFTGNSLDNNWAVFNAAKGRHNWQAQQTSVGGGMLDLTVSKDKSGQWAAGAVSNRFNQKYGKYLVRARLDAAWGTRAIAMLWPQKGTPPAEIDFFEIGASDVQRTTATQTLHYAPNNQQVHSNYPCTCTNWHTFGVEWTPNKLVYTMDGSVEQVIVSPNVTSQPMHLSLSSAIGALYPPNASTPNRVDYQVDWIAIFAPTG